MKHELASTAVQFADIFQNAPSVHEVNLQDGQGNTILDSGRHVYPGIGIGVIVALGVDTFMRRIPETSVKVAAIVSTTFSTTYEGYESCWDDKVPPSKSFVQKCEEGYLDGVSLKHATAESAWDIGTTVAFTSIAAATISFALLAVHRWKKHKGYYKMSQKQYRNMILRDLTPSARNMELVTLEED